MTQFAVIKTGGKQYIAEPGKKIKIEKLDPTGKPTASYGASKKENQEVIFNEVLLLEKNGKLEIGTPFVKNAVVMANIVSQGKGKKVIVFKHKAKTRYKVKKGHRQAYTEVEIKKIEEATK